MIKYIYIYIYNNYTHTHIYICKYRMVKDGPGPTSYFEKLYSNDDNTTDSKK